MARRPTSRCSRSLGMAPEGGLALQSMLSPEKAKACARHSNVMRIGIIILPILISMPGVAFPAPLVSSGDYLFIRGAVVGCGADVRTVDYAEVDQHGEVVVLNKVSLSVADKPVHAIITALADALEERTGHRPGTLEIIWVPGSDQEQIARRLMLIAKTGNKSCSRPLLEPMDPASSEAVPRIAHCQAISSGPDTFKPV